MIKIKVCGLTERNNIKQVVKTGIDAAGFILAESPRKVSLKKVKKLTRGIPPFISKIGVVVNPGQEKLKKIVKSNLFDYLQFHGTEKTELINLSPLNNIKAVSISQKKDLNLLKDYDQVDYFLFDAKNEKKRGGTGEKFNWNYLQELEINKPFILAGGLGPNNIEKAIKEVQPEAVDLNSQIEIKPGIKDIKLLKKTINIIRKYENQLNK